VLTEVPLPEDGGSTWVVDVPAGDILPIWTQARDALKQLGLYPVATTTWDGSGWVEEDLFDRFPYGDDAAPDAVIRRSRALSVEEALGRFMPSDEWAVENWDEVVAGHLELTERYYGDAPDVADIAHVRRGDELALERRLLDFEEALRPTPETGERNESFGWFDPRPHGPVGLALLPLAEPCHASAFLSFYGAEGDGRHEALIRLLCSWQQDFGAQLVASWGTMLQLVASRPAATLDSAFELAAQHARVAPCTTLLPGEGVRQLARHLWRGERWFLHERP
jgi:hypothetical protein